MPISLEGWANWSIAYFTRLFFGTTEIVFDQPNRLRYPRQGFGATMRNLAGTNIHQPFWLGGDAPINLQPFTPIEIDFQPDSEDEARTIARQSALCAFQPQAFFAGIWMDDIWYIPAAPATQTEWQLSRFFPYDLVDINDPTADFLPKLDIDGVAQTIIQTGTPGAGQVLITPGVESHIITTPAASTLGGTFLKLFYPPKFYICKIDMSEEVADTNEYNNSLSLTEFLPNRLYNFTVA